MGTADNADDANPTMKVGNRWAIGIGKAEARMHDEAPGGERREAGRAQGGHPTAGGLPFAGQAAGSWRGIREWCGLESHLTLALPHDDRLTVGAVYDGGRLCTADTAVDHQVHLGAQTLGDEFGVGEIFHVVSLIERHCRGEQRIPKLLAEQSCDGIVWYADSNLLASAGTGTIFVTG